MCPEHTTQKLNPFWETFLRQYALLPIMCNGSEFRFLGTSTNSIKPSMSEGQRSLIIVPVSFPSIVYRFVRVAEEGKEPRTRKEDDAREAAAPGTSADGLDAIGSDKVPLDRLRSA